MSNQPDSKAVDRACRWYRRLLALYPRAHREEYGTAILQLFRDQCRDAWASGGSMALLAFWPVAVLDLLKTSLWEHLATLNRSKIMFSSFRPTFKPLPQFLTLVVVVFLPVFFGIAVITYILPETYASNAKILVRAASGSSSGSTLDPMWMKETVELMQSHEVLEKVVKNLALADSWGKKYTAGQPLNELDVEAMIRNRLQFRIIRNSAIMEIVAFSDNPEEAAKLANGVIAGYRARLAEKNLLPAGVPVEAVVEIIMPASPQPKAVRPNKPLNLMVGSMIGILAGIVVAPFVLGFVGTIGKSKLPPTQAQNG